MKDLSCMRSEMVYVDWQGGISDSEKRAACRARTINCPKVRSKNPAPILLLVSRSTLDTDRKTCNKDDKIKRPVSSSLRRKRQS